MKQFNRKPLFLGLALVVAAPFAFAQSTSPQSSTQSTDPQTTTTQPTQSQDTQSQSSSTTGTQSTDTQSSTQSTAGTESTSGVTNEAATTSTTGAQKRNWSDLDTDKNGSLSATEAAPISSLSQSFSTADANADGELTQDEYKAFLASSGKDQAPGSDK